MKTKEVDFFDAVAFLAGLSGIILLLLYYCGDNNINFGIGALALLAINIIYGVVEKLWGTYFLAFSFIVLLFTILQ
jgi:hypothetical protein